MLDAHGLELVSGWYDGRILEREVGEEWDAILPHLTLLRDLGASHVVYADTSRGRARRDLASRSRSGPRLADGEWAGYGRKITALAERMADFGVGMAFHHHMGTIVETDAEIDRLMATTGAGRRPALRHGPLRCSPAATRRRCSSATSAASSMSTARTSRRPCSSGRGRDGHELHGRGAGRHLHRAGRRLRSTSRPSSPMLAEAGYAGWLVVEAEQDPSKAHPLTYARMGYRNLKAAGARRRASGSRRGRGR